MQTRETEMPPLALLAGGLATRLGETTSHIPKSLVKVAGEPFIAHQLRMLAERRVHDVVICCGHFGEMIKEFAADGARFGCRIRYSDDGAVALGTGGALVNALPLLRPRFWVMYGDSYLPMNFEAVLRAFEQANTLALMTVHRNESRWDRSNVEFRDNKVVRYAKGETALEMQHIDYGLSLYQAGAFVGLKRGVPFDLSVLQAKLTDRGELAGYQVEERFYEIGSPEGLAATNEFLCGRHYAGACA